MNLLLSLSALPFISLQIYAESRIFFSARDVVFARPSSDHFTPGDAVAFYRGDRVIGTGEVFRSREEHVAIKVLSGAAAAPSTTPAARPQSEPERVTIEPDTRPARILVFGIVNAPRIVADKFDSVFVDAMLRQEGVFSSGQNVSLIHRAASSSAREITSRSIRREAERHGAELVIVPEYSASSEGDSIGVFIYSASGSKVTRVIFPVKPFENLVYLPTNERTGSLELVGRYAGISDKVDGMEIDDDGGILVSMKRDLFRLSAGAATYLGGTRRSSMKRSARTRVAGKLYDVAIKRAGAEEDREAIEISYKGELIFRSSEFPTIDGIATQKGLIAVALGEEIELLRIHPTK